VVQYKTVNCVICGKPADGWAGSVLAREKCALCFAPVKVMAGRCREHVEKKIPRDVKYEPNLMGKCVPFTFSELK